MSSGVVITTASIPAAASSGEAAGGGQAGEVAGQLGAAARERVRTAARVHSGASPISGA